MRNMSFFLTTQQMRDETKDVTRRIGWKFLKPGDLVMACVKCQGLGKGGTIERIHPIEIVSVGEEELWEIHDRPIRSARQNFVQYTETHREGFPEMTGMQFVMMFMKEMNCKTSTLVNRIEFIHRKDLL